MSLSWHQGWEMNLDLWVGLRTSVGVGVKEPYIFHVFFKKSPFVTFLLELNKVPLVSTRLYTWISPDGQHRNQIDYILCSQRWRSFIQSAKTRPGADCGSDHELHIAKFRLKLKKVGKSTRPLRCDLNQISYNYTVEVKIDLRD